MDLVFVHGNRAQSTRFLFMEIEPKVLGFRSWKFPLVLFTLTWITQWKSSLLDLIFMTPALHEFHVGPSWDLFSSLPVSLSLFSPHTLSSALTPSLHSLTTFLSSHTTLISQVMFLQYCDYLLGVFQKKKLEYIRNFFFFVSVNIVINLFVSIL